MAVTPSYREDTNASGWNGQYCPSRPLSDEERQRHLASRAPGGYQAPTADPRSRWRPVANRDNDYLLDREAQATKRYSGIPPIKLQDVAMTESMEPVMNRMREHLGTTDQMIIQARISIDQAVRLLEGKGYATGGRPEFGDTGRVIEHAQPVMMSVTPDNFSDFDPSTTLAPKGWVPTFSVD